MSSHIYVAKYFKISVLAHKVIAIWIFLYSNELKISSADNFLPAEHYLIFPHLIAIWQTEQEIQDDLLNVLLKH